MHIWAFGLWASWETDGNGALMSAARVTRAERCQELFPVCKGFLILEPNLHVSPQLLCSSYLVDDPSSISTHCALTDRQSQFLCWRHASTHKVLTFPLLHVWRTLPILALPRKLWEFLLAYPDTFENSVYEKWLLRVGFYLFGCLFFDDSQTQRLAHARQALYHWAAALDAFTCFLIL